MNSIIRRYRFRQPRSNLATNLLFVISAMVFAVIGNAALEQQRDIGMADNGDPATETHKGEFAQSLDLHSLLPRLLF